MRCRVVYSESSASVGEKFGFYLFFLLFFFFKQKTAYEIGTGDWSSDVCSSDLNHTVLNREPLEPSVPKQKNM